MAVNPATNIPDTQVYKSPLVVADIHQFMGAVFPKRDYLLAPWLHRQALTMIYGPRGIAKTFMALGIGYAVANGGEFLSWRAPRPTGVLFIDGEMPGVVIQERLAALIEEADEIGPMASFKIITPDLQPLGMPDLASPEDQAKLEPHLEGINLIIVDNLSSLCRTGRENEAESWLPVQAWALKQRAKGRSVLFIHHAGKTGTQRGTSRREDVLDTVINLRRPATYSPEQGAVVEIHFEKARGLFGDNVKPFRARLVTTGTTQNWEIEPLRNSTRDKILALHAKGLNGTQIASELDVNKSTVSRHLKDTRT